MEDQALHQRLTDEIEVKKTMQKQLEQQLAEAKLAKDKYQRLNIELKKHSKTLQAAERDHQKVSRTLRRSNSAGAITDTQNHTSAQGDPVSPASYSCENILNQMH